MAAAGEAPFLGHLPTRGEALAAPRLAGFWEVVDHMVQHDQTAAGHVYGPSGGG